MLEFLISYQWVFIIIVICNFALFTYVLGPRIEKAETHTTAATKFLTYSVFILSILSFLYGIYLCITLIPTVGTYSGSSAIRSFKGNLFRFLIPIFVLGFNGFLMYACYPLIKHFGSIEKPKRRALG